MQTIILMAILVAMGFVCIFVMDLGDYERNLIEYFNNNSNSVVFGHIDRYIELIEGVMEKIYNFILKMKGYILNES